MLAYLSQTPLVFRRLRDFKLNIILLCLIGASCSLCLAGCSGTAAHHVYARSRIDMRLGSGNPHVQLVVEPSAGYRPLVRAIDRADRTIFMETYILSDRRVLRALERAAGQGVRVYVMLEPQPFGMGPQPHRIADLLRASGVDFRWSRPGFVFTHAKFIVLDDKLAIISSANFSRSAFSQNRDILVFDRSLRDARAVSTLFRADWDRLPLHIDDGELILAPENARAKLRQLLARARRSIDVYAEELADRDVEFQLASAARRGRRVRILVPQNPAGPDRARLLAAGVEIKVLTHPYIHAKVLDIDGSTAFVGSENISGTSLDRNRELGILLRGRPVLRLSKLFERDWHAGAPLRGRRIQAKLRHE